MPRIVQHTFPREIRRDVKEHEVLFAFASDEAAEAFHEWWQAHGADAFSEWCRQQERWGHLGMEW